jgi:hypothetical protein
MFTSSAATQTAIAANSAAKIKKQSLVFMESPLRILLHSKQRGFRDEWPL